MYKQGLDAKEGRQYKWLRDLLDILDQAQNYEDFVAHTKLAMYRDQVFCFTPKGEVIGLPDGATAVDFAYAVHSEVGDHCVGAKINGRLKPLRTQLQNGDQVEIVTSKAQSPSPNWERFVVTAKARARIRRYIRGKLRDEHLRLGRALVEREFHEAGYQYYDKALEGIVKNFKQSSVDDLLAHVGAGYVTARNVVETVYPELRKPKSFVEKVVPLARLRGYRAKKEPEPALPIRGLIPGMAMHFAGCCHPLPGDRIVGIVTTGKGVTIHTIDCESLEAFSDMPERWIDVAWEAAAEDTASHVGRIHLTVLNEPGTLGSLTTAIGRNQGNITNLKITNRSSQFFDMLIDIEVRDVRHLTNIIAALRATPAVDSVDRAYG
jgi:GTP pyrophosphokinase